MKKKEILQDNLLFTVNGYDVNIITNEPYFDTVEGMKVKASEELYKSYKVGDIINCQLVKDNNVIFLEVKN
jgi:hypothetical protein